MLVGQKQCYKPHISLRVVEERLRARRAPSALVNGDNAEIQRELVTGQCCAIDAQV